MFSIYNSLILILIKKKINLGCLLKTKNGEGSKELMSINSPRMHVLQLDVTSSTDVDNAITYIKLHLPADSKGTTTNYKLIHKNA